MGRQYRRSKKRQLPVPVTGRFAAFLTAVLEGYSLEDTMHLATATGASCVEAYDALSGLKSFEELEKKIKAGWKKNNFI